MQLLNNDEYKNIYNNLCDQVEYTCSYYVNDEM